QDIVLIPPSYRHVYGSKEFAPVKRLSSRRTSQALSLTLLILCGLQLPSLAATRDVTTFGAVGNGSHDDTAAIRSAISALTPGDTLLFPCGTYLITSGLNINVSNITVDGSSCAAIHDTASGTAG